MAAFLGFIAQCTPLVSGEHKFLPYRGYVAGCTPQEQWDNIPLYGKLQIFVLVGMLESYGEGASQPDGYVHYMRGGKPGFYPEIKGKGGPGGHFLFNLWDPFNFTTKRTAEQKERGLKCEILNGRAAMVGIMGMLSASTVRSRRPAVVAGFFFDFEAVRTVDAPRRCRARSPSCRASRASRSTRAMSWSRSRTTSRSRRWPRLVVDFGRFRTLAIWCGPELLGLK